MSLFEVRVDPVRGALPEWVTWPFPRLPASHMRVRRLDGKDGITWDELQGLKNQHLGPDVLAVEVYPPEHAVKCDLNMRHLFAVDHLRKSDQTA